MASEIEGSVLRTNTGARVLDDVDIPALLALTEIAILMERKWIKRISVGDLPSTAKASHYEAFGHKLEEGCCARPETKKSFGRDLTSA